MADKNEDTGYVFVYGTLKVDTGPDAYARHFDTVRVSSEEATIRGKLYDFGYFPALICNNDGTVYGELHKYNRFKEVLVLMDQIEGYFGTDNKNNLYRRKKVDVIVKGGKSISALVYEFAQPIEKGTPSVVDGEWTIT